jgi:hypothetical protein
MTSNIYRGPGATGFGAYVAPAVRAKPLALPPKPPSPHRAYRVVLEQVEGRIPRLLTLLMSRPNDRAGRRRWREHHIEAHGRDAYRAELVQARQLEALCRRAIRECWSRVPEAAERALQALDRATDNPARFAARDQLKTTLLGGRNDRMTHVPRKACPSNRPRPRLPSPRRG